MPVYNGAATLGDCLDSVEAAVQRLAPADRELVELVVCDNHSTDDGPQIIRQQRFSCPARVVCPPEHLGNRTENWTFALARCKGEWIEMLHSDDVLADGALAVWLEAVRSPLADGVGFVTGRHFTFEDLRGQRSFPRPPFPVTSVISGRALARWALPLICPFVPFALLRRSVFERIGGLDPSLQLTQDWDLWHRMCAVADVLYRPALVGGWRQHPTGAAYQRLNMREHLRMLSRLGESRDPAVPRAVRGLAARGTAAQVFRTLAGDDSPEADAIREAVGRPAPARWKGLATTVGSVNLNLLRLTGAVRARGRR